MVQCVKRKLDQKNRTHIPTDFLKQAGVEDNGEIYITFDDITKEIKIKPVLQKYEGTSEMIRRLIVREDRK